MDNFREKPPSPEFDINDSGQIPLVALVGVNLTVSRADPNVIALALQFATREGEIGQKVQCALTPAQAIALGRNLLEASGRQARREGS